MPAATLKWKQLPGAAENNADEISESEPKLRAFKPKQLARETIKLNRAEENWRVEL